MSKYLIVESPVHGQDVLLVFTPDSSNSKTGRMTQVAILHPDMNPMEASKTGEDERVCGSCPLRHHVGGSCYVQISNGPSSAYKSWVKQGRPVNTPEEVVEMCRGTAVRFGSYGSPGHIPAWLVGEIIAAARSSPRRPATPVMYMTGGYLR